VRFAFTEDQELFRQALAEMLQKECPHEVLAEAWAGAGGRVPGLWDKLAEMGVVGLTTPERAGGLGMNDLDLVLLLEEAGRWCVPEPLLETTAIAAPLIAAVGGELVAEWSERIASGQAGVAIGLEPYAFVADAASADLLLLQKGAELHALRPDQVKLSPLQSVDGVRRLFDIDWTPSPATCVASGEAGARLLRDAFDRGAIGAAAQLAGLGRQLIDLTVEYTKGREQFGQAIGAFQAVKHHLASAHLKLEFARPLVYHAAYSFVHGLDSRALDVSTAKAYASDAAYLCSRAALQCHGAIAYTYEYHAHMWMKRILVLQRAYGDAAWHRRRAGEILLDA
jgi:alkylation response protein AidB-like acyl-CoA dehydrogenase